MLLSNARGCCLGTDINDCLCALPYQEKFEGQHSKSCLASWVVLLVNIS